ncbi:hypothetical protein DICPUDRAFT_12712, partial [Dictyostelium purpureum]
MHTLIQHFNEEQQTRFEYYKRSSFQRANIKKVMQSVLSAPVNQTSAIVMGGIAKVFVGEIVELARTIMEEWRENGPIRPRHIREAYRRLKESNNIP